MAFYLDAQRSTSADAIANFKLYQEYLTAHRARFPERAYELATSAWYYDFSDHRCPHDGWLESMVIGEMATGERHESRKLQLRIRLLGAYQNGHMEFFYPGVIRYQLIGADVLRGHGDWRYDEFRLSNDGHLLHEIEWSGLTGTARWVIESVDVYFTWLPSAEQPPNKAHEAVEHPGRAE